MDIVWCVGLDTMHVCCLCSTWLLFAAQWPGYTKSTVEMWKTVSHCVGLAIVETADQLGEARKFLGRRHGSHSTTPLGPLNAIKSSAMLPLPKPSNRSTRRKTLHNQLLGLSYAEPGHSAFFTLCFFVPLGSQVTAGATSNTNLELLPPRHEPTPDS